MMPEIRLEHPPAVQTVYFWWENDAAVLAFTMPVAQLLDDSIWRVRMAALDQHYLVPVVQLADLYNSRFVPDPQGLVRVRWSPSAPEAASIKKYATAEAAKIFGTSIWFEDVVGQVATPDEVHWGAPPRGTGTVGDHR